MRSTKSYADKREEIKAKIAKLEASVADLQEKEAEYYPKAGDIIFKALGAGNLKEVRTNWNSRVPEDLKIDKIECDVVTPNLDQSLLMTDRKKYAKQVAASYEAADVMRAAAGEVISNVLHVSLQGDLKDALIELGILEGTKKEEIDTEEVDTFEEEIEAVDEYENTAEVDSTDYEDTKETVNTTYDPFARNY